jgi:hypothetical protein
MDLTVEEMDEWIAYYGVTVEETEERLEKSGRQ